MIWSLLFGLFGWLLRGWIDKAEPYDPVGMYRAGLQFGYRDGYVDGRQGLAPAWETDGVTQLRKRGEARQGGFDV